MLHWESRCKASLLFLVVLACVTLPALAEQTAHQQIESGYARLAKAMSLDGVAGPKALKLVLLDVMAPGELRDAMLGGVESTIKRGGDKGLRKTYKHTIRVVKLTVKGDKASATVEQAADVLRVDAAGEYGQAGKEHRISGTLIFRDGWSKQGGKWKLTSTNMVKQTEIVDGKPWKRAAGAPKK